MCDCMTFPDTVEEFMEAYKVVDTEQVYTNGTEFVPIFRMKQWFEHISVQPDIIRCKDCVYRSIIPDSDEHYWCNQWYASVFDENGYCSRGRREDEQAD